MALADQSQTDHEDKRNESGDSSHTGKNPHASIDRQESEVGHSPISNAESPSALHDDQADQQDDADQKSTGRRSSAATSILQSGWNHLLDKKFIIQALYLFSFQVILLVLGFFQYFSSNQPTSVDQQALEQGKQALEQEKQSVNMQKALVDKAEHAVSISGETLQNEKKILDAQRTILENEKLSLELEKQRLELEKWQANREYIRGCAEYAVNRLSLSLQPL